MSFEVVTTQLIVWLLAATIIWFAVCQLVSVFSGWRFLARHYRTGSKFSGTKLPFESGDLDGWSLSQALVLGCGDGGLYLATIAIFRPGHAPLLVPWNDVHAIRQRGRWMDSAVLEFRKALGYKLRISLQTAERLRVLSGGRLELHGA
jgi:hypothetical protein